MSSKDDKLAQSLSVRELAVPRAWQSQPLGATTSKVGVVASWLQPLGMLAVALAFLWLKWFVPFVLVFTILLIHLLVVFCLPNGRARWDSGIRRFAGWVNRSLVMSFSVIILLVLGLLIAAAHVSAPFIYALFGHYI